jgi:hypothetical protein
MVEVRWLFLWDDGGGAWPLYVDTLLDVFPTTAPRSDTLLRLTQILSPDSASGDLIFDIWSVYELTCA